MKTSSAPSLPVEPSPANATVPVSGAGGSLSVAATQTEQAVGAGTPGSDDWLSASSKAHLNVLIGSNQLNAARRFIQNELKKTDQMCVYVHDLASLDVLDSEVKVEEGKLKITPGPLQRLFDTGGVLLLNAANFSPNDLEAFNTLMEEQTWQGKPLGCRENLACVNPYVRVLCLFDAGVLNSGRLSGAQISRTEFRDFSEKPFPPAPDPVVEAVLASDAGEITEQPQPSCLVVDLRGDSSYWRGALFGGVHFDGQRWINREGAVDKLGTAQRLVIHHAPDDPYLLDWILEQRAQGIDVVLQNPGIEQASQHPPLVALLPVTPEDVNVLFQTDGVQVCVLHDGNCEEVLDAHYGVKLPNFNDPSEEGTLVEHPGLLKQLLQSQPTNAQQAQANTQFPAALTLVSSSLSHSQWQRLLATYPAAALDQHPIFALAQVDVPKPYRHQVVSIAEPESNSLPAFPEDSNTNLLRVRNLPPVSFLYSQDPDLSSQQPRFNEAVRLFITPHMTADELVYTLQPVPNHNPKSPCDAGLTDAHTQARQTFARQSFDVPLLQLQEQPLLRALKQGKTVLIQGLEHNPALTN